MKKILSIDGGGTRGVLPATMLARLEDETGQSIRDLFDVIAGTSTGGIIAIAAALGISMKEVEKLYKEKARQIFADSLWDDLWDGFGKNTGADYSQDNLEGILKHMFGNSTLGTIKDAGKLDSLMVCSFDLNPEDPASDGDAPNCNFRPKVFNSISNKDRDETLVNIALRTSAGPTYFPIRERKYIDGGVAINNPAMAAASFVVNRDKDDTGSPKGLSWQWNEFKILSLGCGTSNLNYVPKDDINKGNWGNIQWIKYLPDLLTESNVQAAEYYITQMMPEGLYMRIQHNLGPIAASLNKGRAIGLDVVDDAVLSAMAQLASDTYDQKSADLLRFIEFQAPIVGGGF